MVLLEMGHLVHERREALLGRAGVKVRGVQRDLVRHLRAIDGPESDCRRSSRKPSCSAAW